MKTIRIPPDLYQRVKLAAKESFQGIAGFIVQAITERLERMEKAKE